MYSFHFGKLLPLYVAVIEHSSVPSPSVYFSLPSRFIPDFQHPLRVLGPSILTLRLLLSLPSDCHCPCLRDVKYHPFTHLHLIFSCPSPSPFHLPSHFSHQFYVLKFVHVSFFLHLFFSPHPPLSKQVLQRLSVIPVTFISHSACKHRNGGEDGGTVMDLDCRRCWACRKSGTEPLKRGGPNQKDVCLESLILVIWFKKTSSGLFLTLAELTATHSGRYEGGIDHFTSSY